MQVRGRILPPPEETKYRCSRQVIDARQLSAVRAGRSARSEVVCDIPEPASKPCPQGGRNHSGHAAQDNAAPVTEQEITMTKRTTSSGAKPRITLTATDHERLTVLANAAMSNLPEVASELADELDRAQVLPQGRHPVDVVCMGSEVEFRDDTTGRTQTVTLVYPNEANIAEGKVSVLTPIGTALIGLQSGKSINWETRLGEMKRLTVLQVREPAPDTADRAEAELSPSA